MKELALSRSLAKLAPRAHRRVGFSRYGQVHRSICTVYVTDCARPLTTSSRSGDGDEKLTRRSLSTRATPDSSYSQPASHLSHDVTAEEKDHFKRVEQESKKKQRASPWTRAGSDTPPVEQVSKQDGVPMTKGKLLTTPSRMLKFIIPLSRPKETKQEDNIEPLALLVHPQQPLSYLERLIQSELPVLDDGKPPSIVFRAEDTEKEDVKAQQQDDDYDPDDVESGADLERLAKEDKTRIGRKVMRTGKLSSPNHDDVQSTTISSPPHDKVNTHEQESDPAHPNFVRWSTSTEVGDFIRDAARGREFGLDIEGLGSIYVAVPTFADRTYYLRMRLKKASKRILELADLKHDCDKLAHRGAKRLAQMGFAGLITWWGAVYYLTFRTNLGWDAMEPVTYLVGLSTLIGGYMWFLYHNREISYRSAMNISISRRQSQLYEHKGFDVQKWEFLVEEGNRLRREIKMIADEYDVEWDETKDEGHKKVADALREERKKEKQKNNDTDDDDDHDHDKHDSDSDARSHGEDDHGSKKK